MFLLKFLLVFCAVAGNSAYQLEDLGVRGAELLVPTASLLQGLDEEELAVHPVQNFKLLVCPPFLVPKQVCERG